MNKKGFTLIETLIALLVTSMLMFLIIDFMTNSIVQYSKTNARSDLLNEAQIGLDIIDKDVRLSGHADKINRWPDIHAPLSPTDNYSWQSSANQLILATAVEDSNGNVVFADPKLYISEKNNNIYFVNDGTLYKRTLASPHIDNTEVSSCPLSFATAICPADKALLNNVVNFNVTYYDDQNSAVPPDEARSIEIQVDLQKEFYGSPVNVSYSTRMVFRND